MAKSKARGAYSGGAYKKKRVSESSSDWAEQSIPIEIWAKSEAGGAYSGGVYIKKACIIFPV